MIWGISRSFDDDLRFEIRSSYPGRTSFAHSQTMRAIVAMLSCNRSCTNVEKLHLHKHSECILVCIPVLEIRRKSLIINRKCT